MVCRYRKSYVLKKRNSGRLQYEHNKSNGLGLAYNMMCILMDEFTLLTNYPVPMDTSLCTAIVAENDAYVLRTHGAPDFRVRR